MTVILRVRQCEFLQIRDIFKQFLENLVFPLSNTPTKLYSWTYLLFSTFVEVHIHITWYFI